MKTAILLPLFLLCCMNMSAQILSKEEALADLEEFDSLIKNESSYIHLADFDYEKALKQAQIEIEKKETIHVFYLINIIWKIVAEIGDRHASVRLRGMDKSQLKGIKLYLPFAVAPMDGKVVALKKDTAFQTFQYLYPAYPYLEKINGILINDFLKQYIYRNKKAPKDVRFYRDLKDLRNLGELFLKNNETVPSKLEFVFTDGKKQKIEILDLKNRRNSWKDIGSIGETDLQEEVSDQKKYSNCDRWLEDSIGYIALPDMVDYEKHPDFESYLKNNMAKYKNAHSIIFDVRGNGGGTREIINQLAPYIVQRAQSPWIANLARIRTHLSQHEEDKNLDGKYLYHYNSEHFDDIDRKAIFDFNALSDFNINFDYSKFTVPFYMVLKSRIQPFDSPIYILINENSFSAASIFASVFKGLPNVQLVGKNTDGSSGRSRYFFLKNSNIRIKLSTMISFQRNLKTLDGNGTAPDIEIDRDVNHILGKKDTQLQKLLDHIKNLD